MTREEIVESVRAAGEDIAKNAESIVGTNVDQLLSIDIWIKAGRRDELTTYQVENEYVVAPQ